MGRMFKLVERTKNGLIKMKDIFEAHVTKCGNEAVEAVVERALNVSSSVP
jgi:hypothetical protein